MLVGQGAALHTSALHLVLQHSARSPASKHLSANEFFDSTPLEVPFMTHLEDKFESQIYRLFKSLSEIDHPFDIELIFQSSHCYRKPLKCRELYTQRIRSSSIEVAT